MNIDTTQLTVLYGVILGGGATAILTEMLKFPFIKIPAQKYPRVTAAVLSALSAVVAFVINGVQFSGNYTALAITGFGAFFLSAATYKTALQGLQTETTQVSDITENLRSR